MLNILKLRRKTKHKFHIHSKPFKFMCDLFIETFDEFKLIDFINYAMYLVFDSTNQKISSPQNCVHQIVFTILYFMRINNANTIQLQNFDHKSNCILKIAFSITCILLSIAKCFIVAVLQKLVCESDDCIILKCYLFVV